MDAWSAISGAAVIGVNVNAAVALVQGMRAQEAPVVARHARRCAWSMLGVTVLCGAATVAFPLLNASRWDGPLWSATFLANMISEAINCVAFGVVVLFFPAVAAVLLRRRARRLSR
jgi:hypothetical protein